MGMLRANLVILILFLFLIGKAAEITNGIMMTIKNEAKRLSRLIWPEYL